MMKRARTLRTARTLTAGVILLATGCTIGELPPPRQSDVDGNAAAPRAEEQRCALPEANRDFGSAPSERAGVSADAIAKALAITAVGPTFSARIYRHDCLIGQTKLDELGSAVQGQYPYFSMTKSIVSLATGRAVTLGALALDDPIGKYLPEADAAHGAITIRQLLTQTSGLRFAWVNDVMASLGNTLDQALALSFVAEPGTKFDYAQTTVTVLGVVVSRAVGMDLQDFVDQQLLQPIGVSRNAWSWLRDGAGNTQGYAWFAGTPVLAAKLGTLVLHRGAWNSKQIISREYIEALGKGGSSEGSYGFLVRTNDAPGVHDSFSGAYTDRTWIPSAPKDLVEFSGFLDQVVVIIPSLDLVVVRLGLPLPEGWDHEFFRALLPGVSGNVTPDPGPYVKPPEQSAPFERMFDWNGFLTTLLRAQ